MPTITSFFKCIGYAAFLLVWSFFTCVALAKAGLVVGPLSPPVCPFVRNTFGVPSLCNLSLQNFSFVFIQTLPNDCSHIEDVHLLFCARFIFFLSFLRGVELRHNA